MLGLERRIVIMVQLNDTQVHSGADVVKSHVKLKKTVLTVWS